MAAASSSPAFGGTVDLVSTELWRELLQTRRFTIDADIAAVATYGLDYPPQDGGRDGYISIETRTIMTAFGE